MSRGARECPETAGISLHKDFLRLGLTTHALLSLCTLWPSIGKHALILCPYMADECYLVADSHRQLQPAGSGLVDREIRALPPHPLKVSSQRLTSQQ